MSMVQGLVHMLVHMLGHMLVHMLEHIMVHRLELEHIMGQIKVGVLVVVEQVG
jgi:hypothetical protein